MRFADLAFLGAITVWIPFLPVGTETVPLIAALFVLIRFPSLVLAKLDADAKKALIGFAVFVFSLLPAFAIGMYANTGQALLATGKLLFGPLFLLTLIVTKVSMPSPGLIKAVVWIHAGLLLLYLTGTAGFLSSIWSRYTYEGRFSFLAHEPSYAATYLFVVGLAVFFVLSRRLLYGGVVALCILATESILGLVYLGTLLVLHAKKRKAVAFIALTLAVGVLLTQPMNNRIGAFIEAIANVDVTDPLPSFVYLEQSATSRVLVNAAGMTLGANTVIGHGLGSFTYGLGPAMRDSVFSVFEENELISDMYVFGSEATPQSYLAEVAFEGGALGILGFAVFCWLAFVKRICSRMDTVTFAFLGAFAVFLFLQSQVSNPLYWYAFYLFLIHRQSASVKYEPPT